MQPPAYKGHGLLGTLGELQREPLKTLERIGALGDFVRCHIPLAPFDIFVANSPALAEEVLINKARIFRKTTHGYQVMRQVLGDGLITSEGDHWLRQRRIAQPAFHKERISTLADKMVHITEETIDAWNISQPVDVLDAMMHLALRISGESLFSVNVEREAATVTGALIELLAQAGARSTELWAPPFFLPTPRNRRFHAARKILDQVVLSIISEHRAHERDDLLSMLLAARDPETGESMSDAQLKDEVMTLFLAGYETTANALGWTLWLLATHGEVLATLHQELDTALGDRAATSADMSRLPFVQAVLKESLRLYPVIWTVNRCAVEDNSIGDFAVPKGSYIFVSQWLLHRQSRSFSEAEKFVPARWLDPELKIAKGAYFPFLTGPRKCIGDAFAMMEMTLVLVTLLRRLDFQSLLKAPPEPEPTITLRPKGGLLMQVSARTRRRPDATQPRAKMD